jgi:hypothetical protein
VSQALEQMRAPIFKRPVQCVGKGAKPWSWNPEVTGHERDPVRRIMIAVISPVFQFDNV